MSVAWLLRINGAVWKVVVVGAVTGGAYLAFALLIDLLPGWRVSGGDMAIPRVAMLGNLISGTIGLPSVGMASAPVRSKRRFHGLVHTWYSGVHPHMIAVRLVFSEPRAAEPADGIRTVHPGFADLTWQAQAGRFSASPCGLPYHPDPFQPAHAEVR